MRAMGDWLAKRGTRFVDSLVVSAGIIVGLLGVLWLVGAFAAPPPPPARDNLDANLRRLERYEAEAANVLGPVDWNAVVVPQEDAR